jgi:hypothetical protein
MNESLKKFLWKKSFDVSAWTEDEVHKITMREPNTAEFKKLVSLQKSLTEDKDGELIGEVLETFVELTATVIVDHDFYDSQDSNKKLASKEIAEFIGSKLDLAKSLLADYMSSLPLTKAK